MGVHPVARATQLSARARGHVTPPSFVPAVQDIVAGCQTKPTPSSPKLSRNLAGQSHRSEFDASKTQESKSELSTQSKRTKTAQHRRVLHATSNNQADGFSVAEKTGNNLIVGKMLKFTIDSKYKVDKADDLPDNTTLVAIDVTTAWVKWQDEQAD